MNCYFSDVCSACPQIDMVYPKQVSQKMGEFTKAFELDSKTDIIDFIGFEQAGVRDRVDLSYRFDEESGGRLGFFSKIDPKEIIDISTCPQMSPSLLAWFKDFRKDLPEYNKMSFRLRVSPKGDRGVWIDTSNENIKKILQEKSWLSRLQKKCKIVEIGQRKKILFEKNNEFKLGKPQAWDWFETYIGEELSPVPLYMNIASFSQPGFKTNRVLIEKLFGLLKKTEGKSVLELCCGSGNLSFALASTGKHIVATELDKTVVGMAEKSLESLGKDKKLDIDFKRLNVHRPSEELRQLVTQADTLVVDPPRSGLKSGLDCVTELDEESLPKYIIYISCFLDSLAEDYKKLVAKGYELKSAVLLDQFPHSNHCEYMVLLEC